MCRRCAIIQRTYKKRKTADRMAQYGHPQIEKVTCIDELGEFNLAHMNCIISFTPCQPLAWTPCTVKKKRVSMQVLVIEIHHLIDFQ